MNDKDINEKVFTDEEINEIIDFVLEKYADGYTKYNAEGRWYSGTDRANEDTIVVVMVTHNRKAVVKICDELKEKLNQSSILVTADRLETEYR